ncbi:hypothetical protein [Pedobacter sp. BMA]|uniref:hypothetical protein n=1 Tax=Pedobacter sp. BMA TaxID=1663685 RepID=UPI000A794400
MEKVEIINTVQDYNNQFGVDTLHPLVSVVNFNEIPSVHRFRMNIGLYAIFLKNIKCGDMIYGCQPYDYEDGTLVFVSPGQTYGINSNGVAYKASGYALVFHPDLILGTHLGKLINDYTFFSYEVNEALHLSKKRMLPLLNAYRKSILKSSRILTNTVKP